MLDILKCINNYTEIIYNQRCHTYEVENIVNYYNDTIQLYTSYDPLDCKYIIGSPQLVTYFCRHFHA